jgi:uncharacterized protein YndB with AHSA1/START domain
MTEPGADNAARGYTITRVFDAPRPLVWKMWTEPEHYGAWFGLEGSGMTDVEMDVRPGGTWSGTMLIPDGPEIHWLGMYLEVEEPERIVIAITDQAPLQEPYETFTVVFNDLGEKTEIVLRQSGGNLTDEQYEETREGTNHFLDRMADHLAKIIRNMG